MPITTHIAGIPHRNPNLSLLSIGDEVLLHPEPLNMFDCNAIAVFHGEVQLGYIPKTETPKWDGKTSAFITDISPTRKWAEVYISTEKPEVITEGDGLL